MTHVMGTCEKNHVFSGTKEWHDFWIFGAMESTQSHQKRHARFHQPGLPYHVMSKTAGGAFLLTPKPGIRDLCAGVVGKAQENYPNTRLYAYAFMSNHIHLIISGESQDISGFMAFIKREISRRIGIKYNLKGPKWQSRYTSTALPTPESQEGCLRYVLAQSVKENLVSHPYHWPGLHCAKPLCTGKDLSGAWFNSTAYNNKKCEEKRRENPQKIQKSDYYERLTIKLSALPHWETLSSEKQRARITQLINDIVDEAKQNRIKTKTRIRGAKNVVRTSIYQRVTPPNPPWWQERRRQIIAWAKPTDPQTQGFLKIYHAFQRAFRLASDNLSRGIEAVFPCSSWMPTRYCSPTQD